MKDTRKYTPFADIFEGIRRHARSIHTALKKGWNCDCETPHIAALRLEKRSKGGWASNFNVAFDISGSKTLPKVRQEVKICIRKESKDGDVLETKSESCPASDDWVNELRSNFRSTSTPVDNLPPRPALPYTVSASSTSSRASFKSIFSKSDSGSSMTSVSTASGSSVLIQENQTKYVPATPIPAEVICCKSLLIILAGSQPENRSRRNLLGFRAVQVSLKERTQFVNCSKLHI
jgi:hypothetical protein